MEEAVATFPLADFAEARNRVAIIGNNQGAFHCPGGLNLAEHGFLNAGTMSFDFYVERRVRESFVQGFECGNLDALGSPRKGQTAIGAKAVAGVKTL